MKKARVSIIKNNIEEGMIIPNAHNDSIVGRWVDDMLANNGHVVNKSGLVDLEEYNIDNKSRKKGSKVHHTVGSMTIDDIINTPKWENTRFFHKVQNQNQITWDENFNQVVSVNIVDMDITVTQKALKTIYIDLRNKLIEGNRAKNIVSTCGRGVFDGYGHPNSYRLRLTHKFMKQIQNIAGSRDTFNNIFEVTE